MAPSSPTTDRILIKCWDRFKKVSRSFSLVIAQLPPPLDARVMLAYAFCRMADTIEDSEMEVPEKRAGLAELQRLLDPRNEYAGSKVKPIPGATADETAMMDALDEHNRLFRSELFSDEQRAVFFRYFKEMTDGMALFLTRKVKTFSDLDEYCHYVAGTVGFMLTELFNQAGYTRRDIYTKNLELANDFGLSLQKINIIKDFATDSKSGRQYWPDDLLKTNGGNEGMNKANLHRMIGYMIPNFEKAVHYTLNIPGDSDNAARVRLFCALPLAMAILTAEMALQKGELVFDGKLILKISRPKTISVHNQLKKAVRDTNALNNYLNDILNSVKSLA